MYIHTYLMVPVGEGQGETNGDTKGEWEGSSLARRVTSLGEIPTVGTIPVCTSVKVVKTTFTCVEGKRITQLQIKE